MAIEGLKGNPNRLPRLGKIRLGQKAMSKKTGREYPEKSDHFICDDPRFIKVYGNEPKELDVMLISGDPNEVAPVFRKRYNADNVLLCKGTGGEPGNPDMVGEALEFNPETRKLDISKKCPCHYAEEGKCNYVMNLFVMLPYVDGIGVWQIDTSGWNSIHSVLDFLAAMNTLEQRGINVFKSVMKLRLVPKDTVIPGTTKSTTIYYLQFEIADRSLKDLFIEYKNKQYALERGMTIEELPFGDNILTSEKKETLKLPEKKTKIQIDTSNMDNEIEMDLHPSKTDNRTIAWVHATREKVKDILDTDKKEWNNTMKDILREWERVQKYISKHHIDSAEYLDYEILSKIRSGEVE